MKLKFLRKKKVAMMSKNYEIKKPLNNGNSNGGAYGSVKTNSDGSSSASRIYDNGADTSSSLSDNFYSENHQNGKGQQQPQPPQSQQNGKIMSSLNGIAESINNQLGFKLPYGAQSSMSHPPPPINQRSSCCYSFYYILYINAFILFY